jgi:hypothetical protein
MALASGAWPPQFIEAIISVWANAAPRHKVSAYFEVKPAPLTKVACSWTLKWT